MPRIPRSPLAKTSIADGPPGFPEPTRLSNMSWSLVVLLSEECVLRGPRRGVFAKMMVRASRGGTRNAATTRHPTQPGKHWHFALASANILLQTDLRRSRDGVPQRAVSLRGLARGRISRSARITARPWLLASRSAWKPRACASCPRTSASPRAPRARPPPSRRHRSRRAPRLPHRRHRPRRPSWLARPSGSGPGASGCCRTCRCQASWRWRGWPARHRSPWSPRPPSPERYA